VLKQQWGIAAALLAQVVAIRALKHFVLLPLCASS
jgi:hypothetical protein